jgi:hypothetical protein
VGPPSPTVENAICGWALMNVDIDLIIQEEKISWIVFKKKKKKTILQLPPPP